MNAHLELLISNAYDGSVAPEHVADLRKSGLTDATIAAQFIRSVPPAAIPRLLGFDLPGIRSAMLFPFRAPAGGFMDNVRVKIFPALTDADGHTIKYLQRKGSAPRLYFVAACLREGARRRGPVVGLRRRKESLGRRPARAPSDRDRRCGGLASERQHKPPRRLRCDPVARPHHRGAPGRGLSVEPPRQAGRPATRRCALGQGRAAAGRTPPE